MKNKNTEAKQFICEFIYKFVDENFDHILYDLSDSKFSKQKVEFLKEIHNNYINCEWVLLELMYWGMDSQFNNPKDTEVHLVVNNKDYFIYDLDGTIINITFDKYGESICDFGYPESNKDKKLLDILQQVYEAGYTAEPIDFKKLINDFNNFKN